MYARVLACIGTLFLLLAGRTVLANHPTDLDHLLQQVKEADSREAAVRREREQRFMAEHADRRALLEEVQNQVAAERARSENLRTQFEENEQMLATLQDELDVKTGNLGELFGTVRQTANDLQALFQDSLTSAQYPGRAEWFDVLAKTRKLPDINELERLWLLMRQEITAAGEISRFQGSYTDAEGLQQSGEMIRVGVFNSIANGRYLRFAPETAHLTELSPQPDSRSLGIAADFSQQREGYTRMVIDPSRGALLNLLIQKPTLVERIQQGGKVGYLIIAVAVFGLGLVLVRLFYMNRVAARVNWQLQNANKPSDDNPLGRVLLSAGDPAGRDISVIESLLDEAIIKETPVLQRGLGLIKLLAAVAPLLGLLGTVTGMILTFQSISLFGTGDPKLMAGGISQALVTTVMGLVAAIPLLFFHTLLASRSRTLIQTLDEQSAGLIAEQVARHA